MGSVFLYFELEFIIHSSTDYSVIIKFYVGFVLELSKCLISPAIGRL